MADIDKIRELIEQIPIIKEKFQRENPVLGRTYDFKKRESVNISMPLEIIYKNPDFMAWRDALLLELSQLKEYDYIAEVKQLLSRFTGFDDKSRLDKIESKLTVISERLEDYVLLPTDIIINDERIPETELIQKITRALVKLQKNNNYNVSSSEDTMNDYVRDILDESYEIKDQTRQGESESGNSAGEIDIQICIEGLPLVMIEALKLKSVVNEELSKHINKVLTKYDPNGCPYAILIVYATKTDFEDFYNRLQVYLRNFKYPYKKQTDVEDVPTDYSELKHAQIVLLRNGTKTKVHFFVAHII
ncbi:MAG: hypothetical protein UHK60_07510 [Acutalibacteraceae bacterium]|nr:hypothetical protein [Acutalibacteraceae bacterium]